MSASSLNELESENVAHKLLILSTTLSGLMVLEYAWNVHFEIRVIWPQLFKRAEVMIFVISRYVGIAGQIFYVWFVNGMSSGVARHPSVCRTFYVSYAAIVQCLLASVEVVLMLRVRQMYSNNYVFSIFAALISVRCAGVVFTARSVLPKANTSPTCMVVTSRSNTVYTGVSTVTVHLSLLAMILWRYFRGNWPEHLRPYLKVTVRDSICAVAAVTGTFVPLTFAHFGYERSQFFLNSTLQATIVSFWFAAGRLVLDKERFRHESRDERELTEVDLDNLEPLEDPDARPASLTDSRPMSAKASVPVDLELGVGTEDITDERYDHQVDEASPSSLVTTIAPMETGDDSEGRV